VSSSRKRLKNVLASLKRLMYSLGSIEEKEKLSVYPSKRARILAYRTRWLWMLLKLWNALASSERRLSN